MKPTNIQIQKAGAQTDILTMAYLPLLIWSVRQIQEAHTGQPLQSSWVDHIFREEEIARLEQEIRPALEEFLTRIDEIKQGLIHKCTLVANRMAQRPLRLIIR